MRKSHEVRLTLLAALALSATGCSRRAETRNCVDAQGRIIPDANCQSSSHGGSHYVYGGSSGGRMGDTVVGASSSSVSRGGFGHGGGDGGGE